MFDLRGRTALITGSSGGIGFALARGLLSAGARVILNGRDAAKLSRAAQTLRDEVQAATGDGAQRVLSEGFDVTAQAEVDAAIARIESQVGAIDILVNNAGMTFRSPLDQFPVEQ